MNMRENSNQEVEIDLLELLHVLLGKIVMIAIVTVLCGMVAIAYTKFIIRPMYSSTSELYVISQSTSITSLADIQIGTQLTSDYVQLITGRTFLEEVIENLDLDYDYRELKKMVSVTNPSDTRILQITVSSAYPEEAKRITDEMANVSRDKISDIMNSDPPNIVQYGFVDERPVNVHLLKNIVIGMILGMVLSAGVVAVEYILDDTVVTEEDIEKYLGLNTLAAIPFKEDEKTKAKKDLKKRVLRRLKK